MLECYTNPSLHIIMQTSLTQNIDRRLMTSNGSVSSSSEIQNDVRYLRLHINVTFVDSFIVFSFQN